MISGIVLAAGTAKRMGEQKLFLDIQGKVVLERVLSAALSSDLQEVVCVIRELGTSKQKVRIEHRKLRWTVNEKAAEGQSTSVICGLQSLAPQSEAALFMVGDQPFLSPDLINGLIGLYRRKPAPIVAPVFQGETRNPVLFGRELFSELFLLAGDRGGKSLIDKFRSRAVFLPWEDESPFLDLDTWEDYERLMRHPSLITEGRRDRNS